MISKIIFYFKSVEWQIRIIKGLDVQNYREKLTKNTFILNSPKCASFLYPTLSICVNINKIKENLRKYGKWEQIKIIKFIPKIMINIYNSDLTSN